MGAKVLHPSDSLATDLGSFMIYCLFLFQQPSLARGSVKHSQAEEEITLP